MLLPQFDTFSIVTLGDPFFAPPNFLTNAAAPSSICKGKRKGKEKHLSQCLCTRKGKRRGKPKEERVTPFRENFVATFCCRLCSIAQQQQQQQHEGQTVVLKDFFNNRRKENLTFVAYVIGNATFFFGKCVTFLWWQFWGGEKSL